ncbi:MAG: hypothetical protein KDA37_03365 [Planctomycetales bacterium]|nr:hypothetical protein [Planctomycetales bacterium]
MDTTNPYQRLFEGWPEALSRRGVLITSLNEAIAFKGFMVKPDMLLLERQAPDALGARFVMLRYSDIAAVKLTDPLKAESFTPLGFEGRLSLA